MQGRGNQEGFDYNGFGGGWLPGTPALEGVVQSGGDRGWECSWSDAYTLQGMDRPDWQGRAPCTAQVRPDRWAEQSVAPETVPGPGRQRRGGNYQLLSGRTLVAAQPTASSMETARPLRLKVPQAGHCSLPHGLAWKEGMRRGESRARQGKGAGAGLGCPEGTESLSPNDPPPALSLRALSSSQTPTSFFDLPPPPPPPPAFSLSSWVQPPDPKLSTWPPRIPLDPG